MIVAEKEQFFDTMDAQGLALTYDDVRLRTRAGSDQPLSEIDLVTNFSEHVELLVPFASAAMDTVTTSRMASAMAKLGGIGVVHAAMSIEQQRDEVRRVKMEINGLIENPVSFGPHETLESVLAQCEHRGFEFRTFPVIDSAGRFVGLLSGDSFKYAQTTSARVGEEMMPASRVVTAQAGTTLPEAYEKMRAGRINTLPLLNDDGTIGGLYLFSDAKRIIKDAGQYNVDAKGQLRVAAAVSTGNDMLERVGVLSKYVDAVVVDTADGDSYYAFQALDSIKSEYPDLDVVIGNISDGASARELAERGANGIKVGQGPGAICTTRQELGIGMPQVTAVHDCIKALGEKYARIPVCADGGIKDRGDVSIAIAAGAHYVMVGKLLAGTAEAPGQVVTRRDGSRVKLYRGMGSESALRDNEASRERYGANNSGLILPEGVESYVPFEGSVNEVLGLGIIALRKSMRMVKAPNIQYHRENSLLRRITTAGLRESHAHDVDVIKV